MSSRTSHVEAGGSELHAPSAHIVATCRWDSLFDDQHMSYQLQEYLSFFSQTKLPEILENVFERYVPENQVFRVKNLELDLGVLLIEDLETQLSEKVENCLSEQLKILIRRTSSRQPGSISNYNRLSGPAEISEILDSKQSLTDFIQEFLLTGIVPWWYGGGGSSRKIFLDQLENCPHDLAVILRRVGIHESTRKRIVCQWEIDDVEKIIALIEPSHHRQILNFANHLCEMHALFSDEMNTQPAVRQLLMSWVLDFLMQQRKAQFHYSTYIEYIFKRYASKFKVEYVQLLQRVSSQDSCESKSNWFSARTIELVSELLKSNLSVAIDGSESSQPADKWSKLNRLLRANAKSTSRQQELQTLLMQLQSENSVALVNALRKYSVQVNIARVLSMALDDRAKGVMVAVMSPQNEHFITKYIERLEEPAQQKRFSVLVIWEIIFSYLLNQSGSTFNRQQFVHRTLIEVSRRNDTSYDSLLALLIEQTPLNAGKSAISGTASFELRRILLSLQDKLPENSFGASTRSNSHLKTYLQQLTHYLSTGEDRSINNRDRLPGLKQMFLTMLLNKPHELSAYIRLLVKQSACNVNAERSFILRCGRLASQENLSLLIRAVAPSSESFLHTFMGQIMNWHGRGRLPALNGFDCYQQLPIAVIFSAIVNAKQSDSVKQLLSIIFRTLNRHYGVDQRQLEKQMVVCLSEHSLDGKYDHEVSEYLSSSLENAFDIDAFVDTADNHKKSKSNQKFESLLSMLREGAARETKLFSKLLDPITRNQLISFLKLVALQVDRKQLLLNFLESIRALRPDLPADIRKLLGIKSSEKFTNIFLETLKKLDVKGGSKARLNELMHLCHFEILLNDSKVQGSEQRLIRDFALVTCQEFGISVRDFINCLELENRSTENAQVDAAIRDMSSCRLQGESESSNKGLTSASVSNGDNVPDYLDKTILEAVFVSLLDNGRLPLWLLNSDLQCSRSGDPNSLDPMRLCSDLCQYRPKLLEKLIGKLDLKSAAGIRLPQLLSYPQILKALKQLGDIPVSQIALLEHFYQGLLELNIKGFSGSDLQNIFYRQTITCWLASDWQGMQSHNIVETYESNLLRTFGIERDEFTELIFEQKALFPTDLTILKAPPKRTLIVDADEKSKRHLHTLENTPIDQQQRKTMTQKLERAITVENAGIVILQDFINTYFERLKLVHDSKFTSATAQHDAIHHLQHLATGQYRTEEQHLLLNKVICGIDIHSPVDIGIDAQPENEEIANSLIEAMIQYWDAIGASSIEGFRGNWLVRQGSLREHDDHWELTVASKPYDLLLQQIPVSFSIIKHPWMHKPINVSWPT